MLDLRLMKEQHFQVPSANVLSLPVNTMLDSNTLVCGSSSALSVAAPSEHHADLYITCRDRSQEMFSLLHFSLEIEMKTNTSMMNSRIEIIPRDIRFIPYTNI